jgi:hypothetical protein
MVQPSERLFTQCDSRTEVRLRVLSLALFLLVMFPATLAVAEPGREPVWLTRTMSNLWGVGVQSGWTMQVQVHATGHAWIRFAVEPGSDVSLSIFALIETAVRVKPDGYVRLRRALDESGMKPGVDASCDDGFSVGIAPIPDMPRHDMSHDACARIAREFETVVYLDAPLYQVKREGIWTALQTQGLDCVMAPEGRASALLKRSSGNSFALQDESETPCLLSPEIRTILQQDWPAAVQQVYFKATVRSIPVKIVLSYDASRPIMALGHELGANVGLERVTAARPGTVGFAGTWRQGIVRFRPASERLQGEAVVRVVPDTSLYFPSSLWTGDIRLSLAVDSRSSGSAKSTVQTHGKQIARCEHVRDCDKLSIEELRGWAAAAYGQCERLRAARPSGADAPTRSQIQISIGSKSCQVSRTGPCLSEDQHALTSLFQRLLDGLDVVRGIGSCAQSWTFRPKQARGLDPAGN